MKIFIRYYRGNIIALFIGIAIPILNQNQNNQGMFFNYFERTIQIPDESTFNQQTSIDNIPSTLDYTESTTESNYFDETTSQDVTTFPDITSSDDMLLMSNTQDEIVTEKIVKPLQYETQGNLYLFFFRPSKAYKTATYTLVVLCFLLLALCMVCCLCYYQKRKVFLWKNSEQHYKLKYSDEDIFSNPGIEDLDVMETGNCDHVRKRRSSVSDIEVSPAVLHI